MLNNLYISCFCCLLTLSPSVIKLVALRAKVKHLLDNSCKHPVAANAANQIEIGEVVQNMWSLCSFLKAYSFNYKPAITGRSALTVLEAALTQQCQQAALKGSGIGVEHLFNPVTSLNLVHPPWLSNTAEEKAQTGSEEPTSCRSVADNCIYSHTH